MKTRSRQATVDRHPEVEAPPSAPFNRRQLWLLATTFLGSFLLFQVQPLIGKIILPWFGGTSSVWTICLLFFQTVLFLGYSYTHLSTSYLGVRGQMILHSCLLALAVLSLPFLYSDWWRPVASDNPTWNVLQILMAKVGLPFFLLATNATLLQRWWALVEDASPYHLYSISNAGSLLALLSYSFLVEGLLQINVQTYLWSAMFVALAALVIGCQWTVWQGHARGAQTPDLDRHGNGARSEDASRPTWRRRWMWIGLSAMGTAMLTAVTNHLCLDVSSVPFLWIAPLTAYLLSFILCFGRVSWYRRDWFVPLTIAGNIGIGWSYGSHNVHSFALLLAINLIGLFAALMVCHGELERSKPAPRDLTLYFLCIAAGGMIGGLFVGIVAPQIFLQYDELPLVMILTLIISLLVILRSPQSPLYGGKLPWLWMPILVVFGWAVFQWTSGSAVRHVQSLVSRRNFYGVLKVTGEIGQDFYYVTLINGGIEHGGQFMDKKNNYSPLMTPTSYYSEFSGLGAAFDIIKGRPNRHIGIVGLGTGTIAAYAEPGDRFRFYEINPDVIAIANDYFGYLSHIDKVGAKNEFVLGDARLQLEQEPDQGFDLLVMDAFTGDAIPTHLLTREAAALYLRHMKPDGIIAVHISNKYVDLEPPLRDFARLHKLNYVSVNTDRNKKLRINRCHWVLLMRPEQPLTFPDIDIEFERADRIDGRDTVWTDRRSSLLELLEL